MDSKETKIIIRKHFAQIYANTFENIDKINTNYQN